MFFSFSSHKDLGNPRELSSFSVAQSISERRVLGGSIQSGRVGLLACCHFLCVHLEEDLLAPKNITKFILVKLLKKAKMSLKNMIIRDRCVIGVRRAPLTMLV